MTVDSYLGGVSRSNVKVQPPPGELLREFEAVTGRAIEMARKKIRPIPATLTRTTSLAPRSGSRASFAATIQGSVRAAFGSAREAYNAHERVMELDTRRRDAGLIVGTYRYLIAGMALPMRWMAYAAGFGGGREKGMTLVKEAADYDGENRTDARVALVLLYNRERRYDEALKQLDRLRAEYPRNRLFWLENGRNVAPSRPSRRSEPRADRGHRPVRRRHATADVRRGGALVPETRRRARRDWGSRRKPATICTSRWPPRAGGGYTARRGSSSDGWP